MEGGGGGPMLAISGERSTGEDVRVQNVTAVAAVANIVKVRKYDTKEKTTKTRKNICMYVSMYVCETWRMYIYICGNGHVCTHVCGVDRVVMLQC